MWKWVSSFSISRWISAIIIGIVGVLFVWFFLKVENLIVFDIFILIIVGVLYAPKPKTNLKGESLVTTLIAIVAFTSLDDITMIPKEIRFTISLLILCFGWAIIGLTSHYIENPKRIDEPDYWKAEQQKPKEYLKRHQQTVKSWWKFWK